MDMKEILKEIYKQELDKGYASLEIPSEFLKEGYVYKTSEGYKLTEKGRRKIKVIVCGGVFDILHPGHGFFLEKAKEYGDFLVVIVARDSTVKKKKRIPIIPEEQRVEMLKYLKPVDIAILGTEGHFLDIIEKILPDVIVLGPDQNFDEKELEKELEKRGLKIEIKRIREYKNCPLHSTREILKKIVEKRVFT